MSCTQSSIELLPTTQIGLIHTQKVPTRISNTSALLKFEPGKSPIAYVTWA